MTSALAARRATWLMVAVLAVGCSGETSPPSVAPTPTPTPSPSPAPADPANVAGTWTGTLESAGFAPRRITILAFQGGTCVDGAWRSVGGTCEGDGVERCEGLGGEFDRSVAGSEWGR